MCMLPLCFLPSAVNHRVLVQHVVLVITLAILTANIPHFKRVIPERPAFVVRRFSIGLSVCVTKSLHEGGTGFLFV